jgi:selenide,water dikinase
MLPGHVAGHYARDALEIDLVRLARFAGARLVLGRAEGIDRAARRIHVPGRPPIRYDIASIDIGITSDLPSLPGFAAHAVPAKPLGRLADRWAAFCAEVAQGAPADVVVIGAGVAGVELALAMHHRLTGLGATPRIALVEAGRALAGLPARSRRVLRGRLAQAGIALHEDDAAAEVTSDTVRTASGRVLPARLAVGAAGARPHDWLGHLGLDHDHGFLTVDATLRSVTDRRLFAAGDCAHLGFAPRPKAGVYAVRAAPVLAHNLRAALAGGAFRRFRPQRDYLKLVSLGAQDALADRSGLSLAAPWLWRWKDRIDRRFMERLADLPPMPPPRPPRDRARGVADAMGTQPPCAGCGAKLGARGLAAGLAALPAPARADIASAPGDDAAILRHGAGWQVATTDHLPAFTEDPVTFARIAAVHALGDVWAMGATPQAALATVILPRMTGEMAEATLAELLATAAEVFRAAGADLAGGHTTMGPQMTLGFAVTGLADSRPIGLGGARPGDALLLTKPLGSGTLLAAEMQGRARGADVAAALVEMARPQGAAAAALSHARAMTDVTGFGLAGHLLNICRASGTGAALALDALPLLPGAEALAAAGLRSTLWSENRAALAGHLGALPDTPRAALLFDPQTAGGLLAAVGPDTAEDTLAALRAAGYPAARIGAITGGPPRLAAT